MADLTGDPRRAFTQTPDPTVPPLVGDPRAMMGSLAQPGPLAAPLTTPKPTYTSPTDLTGRVFLGHAPTATPYGDFTAPGLADIGTDPAYQLRQREDQQAIERSAASHGTLLNGGTLKALQDRSQALASDEYGKSFDRALQAYTTNRATNQQNFDQTGQQFRGDLDIFGANNSVGQGWARIAADQPQPQTPATPSLASVTSVGGGPAAGGGLSSIYDYAAQVAAQRAQNEAESARVRGPVAKLPGYSPYWENR